MPPEAKLGSTLIWYKASSPSNMEYWFKSVDKFLEGDIEFKVLSIEPMFYNSIFRL